MRKVIMTGFPCLCNVVEALNKGADAYLMKPLDIKNVLETISDQLSKQQGEKKFSQEKVAEFIETRVKELERETTPENKETR